MGFFSGGLGSIAGAAIGGLVGGPLGMAAGAQIGSTYDNNKANKIASSREYAYTLDMWNRTNEYNTPANQMKRYEEAGLNPNLIYGQSNTTSAGSTPSVQPSRYNYGQSLINYFTIQNMSEQNRLLSAQARQAEANIPAVTATAEATAASQKEREEIIKRTGVDPEGAGPVAWAARPANWIAKKYEALEQGIGNFLRRF